MAESAKKEGHIVMAPFMAHGHLIPFLALARQLQQRTHFTITIATTPLNIQYLRSAIFLTDSDIHLAELPFNPTRHDLPPNIENTEKLPLDGIIKLSIASLSLEDPLRSLISQVTQQEGHPPLCIIFDMFLGWVTRVANTCGTKNITFITGGAYGYLAYISVWSNLPHRKTDSDEFWVPGWICNTVEELEPLGLQLLREYLQLPVWSVGPLLQPVALKGSSKQHAGKETGIDLEACIEWLNLKDQSSVLYISFGSQNTIGASQMMALAEGLEQSGKPFVWVIRPPLGFDMNGEFSDEWLPKGFEKRMRDTKRGLLVHKWGPQLEILSHRSTGAFLSHCGWNSLLESLSHGVPIIGWPLIADQVYNPKVLVEEIGACLVLTQTAESVISGEEVKKVIEVVMDQEGGGKGKEMKEKANEIAVRMRKATTDQGAEVKGSSMRAMDDFARTILSNS